MQITIRADSRDLDPTFIYKYLPDYIYKTFIISVDLKRLKEYDEFFEIDSLVILTKALRNLLITRNGNYEYTIKINKMIKVDDVSIES